MKKLVTLIVLVAVVVVGGKYLWQQFEEKSTGEEARARVTGMLRKLQQGGTAAEQDALGLWAKGSPMLSEDEVRAHLSDFERFQRDGGLGSVGSFSVEGIELQRSGRALEARVSCKLDGRSRVMLVRKDRPIAWAR